MTVFQEHKQVHALFIRLCNCLRHKALDQGSVGNYKSKSYHATKQTKQRERKQP